MLTDAVTAAEDKLVLIPSQSLADGTVTIAAASAHPNTTGWVIRTLSQTTEANTLEKLRSLTPPTPGHVIMGRRFFYGGIFVVVGSIALGAVVLKFMVTSEGTWDFQGSSGVASTFAGLAGVILAGWAIYHQLRLSAPSHRAAEEAIIEISDFRRSYSKIASVVSASVTDAPMDETASEPDGADLDAHLGPLIDIKTAIGHPPLTAVQIMSRALNQEARREANNKIKTDRAARELRIDIPHSCSDSSGCSACDAEANSGRRSFASMATKVLPLLDTLQHHGDFPENNRVDMTETEELIDFLGHTYGDWDELYDSHDWCGSVIDVIHRLDVLITILHSKKLLEPSAVEKALLEPKQSLDIQKFKDKFNKQTSLVPSDRARRFGSAGVTT